MRDKPGEVPSRLVGRLGPVEFWRASTYWVVEGPVPVTLATELYEDPIGSTGTAAAPPPSSSWVRWYLANGTRVLPTQGQVQYESLHRSRPDFLPFAVFHDDPKSLGASGFVESYNVDTEIGLRLLSDAIRRHGLHETARPPWWTPDP